MYAQLTAPGVTVIEVDTDVAFFSGEQRANIGTREEDVLAKLMELMLVDPDQVEPQWNAWLEQMRPIVQPAIDEMNAGLAG